MIKPSYSRAAEPEICLAKQTARLAGREIKLPDLSFRLLRLLSERAPEPVSFDEIERVVWAAHVSRETIKQRVKILRDSLQGLGVPNGGIESARNVGYRLTQTLVHYEPPVSGKPPSGVRRFWAPAVGLALCLCAVLVYLFLSDQRGSAKPLSLSVHSNLPVIVGQPRSPAWDAAQQTLIRELSRMSNLVVVASGDGQRETDLVVEMDRVPDGPYETLAFELIETGTGTKLWAETFGLDQDGYDKPISTFVVNVHKQIVALGLQPGQEIGADQANQARQHYLSASSLAKTEKEADLLAAKARLDSALDLRPTFAIARSLRARINARLVIDHGRDQRLALQALNEAQSLVDAFPDVPEFRRTLATAQVARGALPEALENLEKAERNMPFLRSDIAALRRRIPTDLP